MCLSTVFLLAALVLGAQTLPTEETAAGISKRQGLGVIPEILMIAIVDAGDPAVEAFGFGAQIASELFGDLAQDEPYKDKSNCRMEVHTDDSSCTMTTYAKNDATGTKYQPDTCAFGTPVTYNDPIVGEYTLNFQTTNCPNSNKCNPVVNFTSHWFANASQTGISLDFSADDDDGDFQGSGKKFTCESGESGGYYWLCAVPCGQEQPNAAGYAPGWCGVHVVQYQKNEGPAASDGSGTSDYRMDVTIYDTNQNQIGQALSADAPDNKGVAVDSQLPYTLDVAPGSVDSDPITFAYGSQTWAYADAAHQCNFGAYDSGKRQGDCGFTC